MRILFCNYEYPPLGGGGGVVNAALARELARDHDVTVLTSCGLGLPELSVVDGVRIVRAPVWFRRKRAVANFASMLAYVASGTLVGRRLVRRERFDVINTHFVLPSGPVGDQLSRAGGVPNVLSVHGGDLYDPSKRSSAHRHAPLRAEVRRLARRADAVVAQSSDTRENLRRYYAPEIDAEVIPLGISQPPPVQCSRPAHGYGDDDVLLISVGRLVDRKRVDRLIEAVAQIGDPRVRLLLLGDGPRRRELEAYAERLGVERQIDFKGAVDETTKYELLSVADLYVSTSQHEGFGLVFLEAMASALPVVCYAHGGQRDFLEDGVTGCLVPLNDLSAWVDGCRRLIEDPARRDAIGRANRERVSEFLIERCARRYEELFESVLRGRASPRPAEAAATGVERGRVAEGAE